MLKVFIHFFWYFELHFASSLTLYKEGLGLPVLNRAEGLGSISGLTYLLSTYFQGLKKTEEVSTLLYNLQKNVGLVSQFFINSLLRAFLIT